ncbi:MAG: hypothetical protein CBB71_02890 [Rhodopirellula sp. TMED11]|nr:MAG: hypothetical protein CBB71_02890 [Rhodopirellula sp. TMED11]
MVWRFESKCSNNHQSTSLAHWRHLDSAVNGLNEKNNADEDTTATHNSLPFWAATSFQNHW